MSLNITMKSALDAMCQIVGEHGVDHVYLKVYGSCVNWDVGRDCPSCPIGHVMHRLGVDREFMWHHASVNAADLVDYICRDAENAHVEDGVATILVEAQKVQDSSGTWGQALYAALEAYQLILAYRRLRQI
jgi:hypothetical protein